MRHQMIFTTTPVIKGPVINYAPVTQPPRVTTRNINTNPNSFLRGLVFPSKAGCGSCGR
jgi:hypothetical protein